MKWKKRNLGPLCHDEPSCQLYTLIYFKCFIREKESLLPSLFRICGAGTHACLYVCRGQRANGWVSIYFSPSYLYVCGMCIWRRYLWRPEESAGVIGSCELWYRCWQSQQVFSAAELWSQLYSFYILRWISHWIWRSSTVASQQASEIFLSLPPKHRDLKTCAAIPGWGSAHSTQVFMLLTQ